MLPEAVCIQSQVLGRSDADLDRDGQQTPKRNRALLLSDGEIRRRILHKAGEGTRSLSGHKDRWAELSSPQHGESREASRSMRSRSPAMPLNPTNFSTPGANTHSKMTPMTTRYRFLKCLAPHSFATILLLEHHGLYHRGLGIFTGGGLRPEATLITLDYEHFTIGYDAKESVDEDF